MTIPQFSLRWLLGAVAVVAVVFWVVSRALAGNPWAGGVSIALTMLVIVILVQALLFWIFWMVSVVAAARARRLETRRQRAQR